MRERADGTERRFEIEHDARFIFASAHAKCAVHFPRTWLGIYPILEERASGELTQLVRIAREMPHDEIGALVVVPFLPAAAHRRENVVPRQLLLPEELCLGPQIPSKNWIGLASGFHHRIECLSVDVRVEERRIERR